MPTLRVQPEPDHELMTSRDALRERERGAACLPPRLHVRRS